MKVLYLRVSPILKKRIADQAKERAKFTGEKPNLADTTRSLLAERLGQLDGKRDGSELRLLGPKRKR